MRQGKRRMRSSWYLLQGRHLLRSRFLQSCLREGWLLHKGVQVTLIDVILSHRKRRRAPEHAFVSLQKHLNGTPIHHPQKFQRVLTAFTKKQHRKRLANICFFAHITLILHEQIKNTCMKSSILGLWLSGSTPMEDSLQHSQIKYSHEAKQTKQYSLWCFNVFLAIPLQSLLLSL